MQPVEIEARLQEQATLLGISDAKLRAIYRRGVKECMANGYAEEPFVHGLARVQRYVLATQMNNHRITADSDLLPKTTQEGTSLKYEMPQQSWPLVAAVMGEGNYYTEGDLISHLFPSEDVVATSYNTDTQELKVCGTDWCCILNLSNHEYTLDFENINPS